MRHAKITEIFKSIQGEGLLCGTPMLFVRFSGCNLKCDYCDTGYARKPGHKYSIEKILQVIKRKAAGVKWISITGGEPLLRHEFLALLLPRLKKSGYKIYLETNGTLHSAFEKIKKYIDLTCWNYKFLKKCRGDLGRLLNPSCSRKSLTCKLTSAGSPVAAGFSLRNFASGNCPMPNLFYHSGNLPRAKIFIKAVITENTPEKAVIKLYEDIKNTGCPLVLMPVRRKVGHSRLPRFAEAGRGGNLSYCHSSSAMALATKYTKLLSSKGLDARLIPGFHTIFGIK